ncbi:MAG: nitrilase-related carbon-nitrogen hydrolase [Thermoplasmatota archaeon]
MLQGRKDDQVKDGFHPQEQDDHGDQGAPLNDPRGDPIGTIPESEWKDPLEVCIVQPKLSLGNIEENLSSTSSLIESASREGPMDIVVLPEVFATGFHYESLPELSKKAPDTIRYMGKIAREHSTAIMFTLVINDKGRFYNRFMVLDRDGRKLATYDKTHLFSRAGEDEFFTPGKTLTEFSLEGARIAPLICYEVRFPELARKHVLNGVDILVYPAQWPAFRIFQWETLIMARAIENQCYVIGVGGVGDHGPTAMGGHSMVVAPFGDVLCRLDDSSGYARARIDPGRIREIRRRIPVLVERRPELY